jgi:CspA family cold shock protein
MELNTFIKFINNTKTMIESIYIKKEQQNMANYTGVVKWFDNERGYGFISTNEGNDVFLHHSQVKEKGNDKDIHEGEQLSFDIIQDKKGPSATNVQKI